MWVKLIICFTIVGLAATAGSPKSFKRFRVLEEIEPESLVVSFPVRANEDSFRLPNTSIPLHYDIWLSTDIHRGEFEFQGRVAINILVVETTNLVTLHYSQLDIVSVTLQQASRLITTVFNLRPEREFILINSIGEQLQAGSTYTVIVNYIGILREDDYGFYKSWYVNENDEEVWQATTQFQATEARHAFPSYDEPGLRSTFDIEIRHDQSFHALSNMPVISRIDNGDGTTTTRFDTVPPIQTYLIAFTVSDFIYLEDTLRVRDTPQKIYAKASSIEAGEAEYAMSISEILLSGFEEFTNIPYTLPKMDQVAIPRFAAGAMENWGLISYREPFLLYRPGVDTTDAKEFILIIINHEFAHQWFGNLVNPVWWSYLWINEGFASLYENDMAHFVWPDERWIDTFLIDTVHRMMEIDAHPNIRPMTIYVEHPDDILALFDSVTYWKAGSVLKMIQNALGHPTWRKGLNYFLTARNFTYTTPQHLHESLQQAANEDIPNNTPNVGEIMEGWESQPGFPFITVSRNGTELTIEQNRFMYADRNSSTLWWIPINYVVGSNPNYFDTRPDFWLRQERSRTINGIDFGKPFTDQDWIIVNIQQSAYYRVNYEDAIWELLIEVLNRPGDDYNQIHVMNRAQLIDDSHHLARAGILPYDHLLRIMTYMNKEIDYVPWASANRANTLLNRWLAGTTVDRIFQNLMRRNIWSLFSRLGVRYIDDEPRVDRYARVIAINIACQTGMPECLDPATEQLANFVYNGISIEPDLVDTIHCNGIRTASTHLFLTLQFRMLESPFQAERNTIISGLGCTHRQDLLNSYLYMPFLAIDLSFTQAERSRILLSPLNQGPDSIQTMINFVSENADVVNEANLLATACANIANRIHTQVLFNDFDSLLDRLGDRSLLSVAQIASYRVSARTILDWQDLHLEASFSVLLQSNAQAGDYANEPMHV